VLNITFFFKKFTSLFIIIFKQEGDYLI